MLRIRNERSKPLNSVRETVTVASDEGGGAGVAGTTGGAPEVIGEIGCIGSGICSDGCAAGAGGGVSVRISSYWA